MIANLVWAHEELYSKTRKYIYDLVTQKAGTIFPYTMSKLEAMKRHEFICEVDVYVGDGVYEDMPLVGITISGGELRMITFEGDIAYHKVTDSDLFLILKFLEKCLTDSYLVDL